MNGRDEAYSAAMLYYSDESTIRINLERHHMKKTIPVEVFSYCLENPDNLSIEQLLDKFPTYQGELQSLLAVDRQLKHSLLQPMPDDAHANVKAKLLAAMAEQNAAARTASEPVAERPVANEVADRDLRGVLSRWKLRIFQGRRLGWVISGAISLVLLLWYFSSTALADSPFYNVKLVTENQLLTFASSSENLAKGHFQLANVRLLDLRAMRLAGTFARSQPAFDNYVYHFHSGVGIWEGVSKESRAGLTKLLYLSSVAGENDLGGLDSIMDSLPTSMQSNIKDMLLELRELNITTGTELTDLGIKLDALPEEADDVLSVLLTPVPGFVPPTATPAPTPTAHISAAVPTFGPSGSLSSSAARVPDPHSADQPYFPLTGHTVRGVFHDYWQQEGGLQQFGYPITEEHQEYDTRTGKTYLVQYFERVRFEYHPESRSPNKVMLGLLGSEAANRKRGMTAFEPTTAQVAAGTLYFHETQHNVSPQFVSYWRDHGGLQVYGFPVSEAFYEVSPTNGMPYLVQYFERSRLEYHPEMAERFRVSLGLLGSEALRAYGLIP